MCYVANNSHVTDESPVGWFIFTEAVAQRCSVKKVFLEISQISQENTCARVNFIKKETLAQVFSCIFCEISKSSFS